MSLRSTPLFYGAMPVALHWLTALAVILLLVSGQVMAGAGPEGLRKILPVHVAMGLAVGLLTLARIAWWLFFDRRPEPLAAMGRMQARLAGIVHGLLYLALLVMVASGVAMLALSGAVPRIFGGGALPDFSGLPPFFAHSLVSKLLLVLVLGHVGAALHHHFIRRDGLLARMAFGARPRS